MALNIENYLPVVMRDGLNTAKNITASGTNTFSGATTLSGGATLSGSNTISGATTFSAVATFTTAPVFSAAPISRRNVLASSGNTTLTVAMSGSVMLLDGATVDYTLPAVAAGDVGVYYDFVVTVTSTDQSITAGAADLLIGGMVMVDIATPLVDGFKPDVSDDLIFSTNGTTTGGVIGSCYRFTCITATRWWVEGINYGSGTLATPFS